MTGKKTKADIFLISQIEWVNKGFVLNKFFTDPGYHFKIEEIHKCLVQATK